MFTKSKKSKKEDYQYLDSPTSPKKRSISIFIKNEVHNEAHQEGQRQEQKQDKKDESQNGCVAWIKSLCK